MTAQHPCPSCGDPVTGAVADTAPDGSIRVAFVPCGCGEPVDPSAFDVARQRLPEAMTPAQRIAERTAREQGLPPKVEDPVAAARLAVLLDVPKPRR